MNINIHQVRSIKASEPMQLDSGTFYRSIFIETPNESVEVCVYAEDTEDEIELEDLC